MAVLGFTVEVLPRIAADKFTEYITSRDFRHTLENNSDKPMNVVMLRYNEYGGENASYYVTPPQIIAPGDSMKNVSASCVYVVDAENRETRSFDLTDEFSELFSLEEEVQRRTMLNSEGEPCARKLEDVQRCRLSEPDLVPIEQCFSNK